MNTNETNDTQTSQTTPITRTRIGKIARLPRVIRDELNQRLRDGEPGIQLVEWLNGLPEVKAVLAGGFGGRAISEQNLSEWRQGGYAEWLRREESLERVRQLTEYAKDLDKAADGMEVTDRLARVLTAELIALTETLRESVTDPKERSKHLREIAKDLARLRQGDHRAAQVRIEEERNQREKEKAEEARAEREEQERKRRVMAPVAGRREMYTLGEYAGGGEIGRAMVAPLIEERDKLALGTLLGILKAESQAGGTKPIRLNPSKSNPHYEAITKLIKKMNSGGK